MKLYALLYSHKPASRSSRIYSSPPFFDLGLVYSSILSFPSLFNKSTLFVLPDPLRFWSFAFQSLFPYFITLLGLTAYSIMHLSHIFRYSLFSIWLHMSLGWGCQGVFHSWCVPNFPPQSRSQPASWYLTCPASRRGVVEESLKTPNQTLCLGSLNHLLALGSPWSSTDTPGKGWLRIRPVSEWRRTENT